MSRKSARRRPRELSPGRRRRAGRWARSRVLTGVEVFAPPVGDRQPAVTSERLERDLRSRRVLAALVLGAVGERDDALDEVGVEPGGDQVGRPAVLLDVVVEDVVEQRRSRAGSRCRAARVAALRTGACRCCSAGWAASAPPPRRLGRCAIAPAPTPGSWERPSAVRSRRRRRRRAWSSPTASSLLLPVASTRCPSWFDKPISVGAAHACLQVLLGQPGQRRAAAR